jgi:hypothetical protein
VEFNHHFWGKLVVKVFVVHSVACLLINATFVVHSVAGKKKWKFENLKLYKLVKGASLIMKVIVLQLEVS